MNNLVSRDAVKKWLTRWEGYIDADIIARMQCRVIDIPSEDPEWNNHTVACLLAELFDDTCACNYNGIDEWLPEKCEVIDACPNPVGVACWEQYLKYRERKPAMSDDLISRQAAIEAIKCAIWDKHTAKDAIDAVCNIPSEETEPLTDKEQRIFLAAMAREEKVCEEVDRNYVREPYEDSLMRVCKEIRRKVKGALWT